MNCYVTSSEWTPQIQHNIFTDSPDKNYSYKIARTVNNFVEEVDKEEEILSVTSTDSTA